MSAKRIFSVVADDFSAVDQTINQQLTSNVPLVSQIGKYIVGNGGKRLRPLLVLLAAKSAGYQGQQHIPLAAIIEFLHTATLLHDDVVDESDLRRQQKTANAKWGNASSVLVGDFLYSRAFQMIVELGSLPIMAVLSTATSLIAEGEVMQLTNIRNPNVSEDHYLSVIKNKTAVLFEAASHTGALIADPNNKHQEYAESLRLFGLELGMAFQLVDDVLDYLGDSATMGKNVGDDLAEGKPTLPLIYAMEKGTQEEQTLIRQTIRRGGIDDLDAIMKIIQRTGATEYTMNMAKHYAHQATARLKVLPSSPYTEALKDLALLAIDRVQ